MRALIVYESMYGNTRKIAEAVARGLGDGGEVRVLPVGDAADVDPSDWDLLIVGGPTHAHGMTRGTSRHAAAEAAAKPDSGLTMEPAADAGGLREWLDSLGRRAGNAAAFDTRIDASAFLTGRASKGIGRKLEHSGYTPVAEPESFLVTSHNELVADEEERARAWGGRLASDVGGQPASPGPAAD